MPSPVSTRRPPFISTPKRERTPEGNYSQRRGNLRTAARGLEREGSFSPLCGSKRRISYWLCRKPHNGLGARSAPEILLTSGGSAGISRARALGWLASARRAAICARRRRTSIWCSLSDSGSSISATSAVAGQPCRARLTTRDLHPEAFEAQRTRTIRPLLVAESIPRLLRAASCTHRRYRLRRPVEGG